MSLTATEINRYAQQIKLPEIGVTGQAQLKNAKVLCVGAGGLASSLLYHLAAAGIGTVGIIDDDHVELNNLARQILFNEQQIGQAKVESAKQSILQLNAHVHINTYQEQLTRLNAQKYIEQYDIVADCSDNFATRFLINDVCYDLNKPYAFASISAWTGHFALFLGKTGPCLRCLFDETEILNSYPDCNSTGVLGVLTGLLGTLQAAEIIKWQLNSKTLFNPRLLIVDLLKLQFQEYQAPKKCHCKD